MTQHASLMVYLRHDALAESAPDTGRLLLLWRGFRPRRHKREEKPPTSGADIAFALVPAARRAGKVDLLDSEMLGRWRIERLRSAMHKDTRMDVWGCRGVRTAG